MSHSSVSSNSVYTLEIAKSHSILTLEVWLWLMNITIPSVLSRPVRETGKIIELPKSKQLDVWFTFTAFDRCPYPEQPTEVKVKFYIYFIDATEQLRVRALLKGPIVTVWKKSWPYQIHGFLRHSLAMR